LGSEGYVPGIPETPLPARGMPAGDEEGRERPAGRAGPVAPSAQGGGLAVTAWMLVDT